VTPIPTNATEKQLPFSAIPGIVSYMSKVEKLLQCFLLRPKDFTYDELRRLLSSFGYEEARTGKTAGSRTAFYNATLDDMIKFHRPHPSQMMKRYCLNEIENQLSIRGVIK